MAQPSNLSSLNGLGNYIELYDLDCTNIGGAFYRFTANTFADATSNSVVYWQGNQYTAIPLETRGWEAPSGSSAPARPTMRVSNVKQVMLPAVIALGDIVGAKVTRWRTFTKYLDGQPSADPTCYFAPVTYYVQQMRELTQEYIEWQLASYLDREGIKLPREQVLRDVNAPGVSIYRQR